VWKQNRSSIYVIRKDSLDEFSLSPPGDVILSAPQCSFPSVSCWQLSEDAFVSFFSRQRPPPADHESSYFLALKLFTDFPSRPPLPFEERSETNEAAPVFSLVVLLASRLYPPSGDDLGIVPSRGGLMTRPKDSDR